MLNYKVTKTKAATEKITIFQAVNGPGDETGNKVSGLNKDPLLNSNKVDL
jgi:hypothetical protein